MGEEISVDTRKCPVCEEGKKTFFDEVLGQVTESCVFCSGTGFLTRENAEVWE